MSIASKIIYEKVFLKVVRPMLQAVGLDLVYHHRGMSLKAVWEEILRYRDVAEGFMPTDCESKRPRKKIIWQFWWQGADSAPEIVKKCMLSVRKHADDWEVVVIDKNNLGEYLEIPPLILERLDRGEMSITHFSDYLRARLLAQYGGIWADATVMMTDDLPKEILNAPFFMYKSPLWANGSEVPRPELFLQTALAAGREKLGGGADAGSSWFLAATSGSPIMSLIAVLMEKYWSEHHSLVDYYLFHKFLAMAVCFNYHCREEYLSAPAKTNISPHLLQLALREEPVAADLSPLVNASSIHKLSYKGINAGSFDLLCPKSQL